MMIQNLHAHRDYLNDLFNQFANLKIENKNKNEKLKVPLKIQKFVEVDDVWNDAIGKLNNNHFYAIGCVGSQGSGKTTVASQFAKKAKEHDFRIIYALPEDYLTDVPAWIERVTENPSAKTCIVYEDISYSFDTQHRKQQSLMKNVIARLRHIFQGQVFVIYITHRLHAAPPMLRNAGTWIFTELTPIDRDDMLEIIGKTKEQKELLESMQLFLTNCATEGNKHQDIHYTYNNEVYKFRWGNEQDFGDGRLMASLHNDRLVIFNSKVQNVFDLMPYRSACEVDM